MKNEIVEKNMSMVKILRDIRDKINVEIADMSTTELKAYFKKHKRTFISEPAKTSSKVKV